MDRATGLELGALPCSWVLSLAFSPDGKTLASGVVENAIFLWDVGDRRLVRKLDGDKQNAGFAYGHFSSLAFAPDGKTLASAGNDAVIRLWDVATGNQLRRLMLNDENEFCTCESVAFSPDGSMLAASGRAAVGRSKIRLWETATGKEFASQTNAMNAPSGQQLLSFPESWEQHVSPRIIFSPDGKMLAMNRGEKTIPIWEVASGKERLLLEGHQESTECVAFSPDGRTLASAGWDNTIRLWDLQTGKELRQLQGHRGKANSLVFSLDSKTLISAGDDTTLLFWDLSGVRHRPRPLNGPLSPKEQAALWEALADTHGARAYQAIRTLSAAPGQTVPLLKRYLQPARAPDQTEIARLINDLDNTRFEARQKATTELDKLGDLAESALRKKLAAQPSLESRQRVERLLQRLTLPGPERLRTIRAIEVLEQIGTPQARQLLETLAEGAPGARSTREAAASVLRLTRRAAAE
jgi:WD40 repeat protein